MTPAYRYGMCTDRRATADTLRSHPETVQTRMSALHDFLVELGFRPDPIEWRFLQDSHGLWLWEYAKNGAVLMRSNCSFATRELCVSDASDNGYSRLFSRDAPLDDPA